MDGRKNREAMDGAHAIPRAATSAIQLCRPACRFADENGIGRQLPVASRTIFLASEDVCLLTRMLPALAGRIEDGFFRRSHTNKRQLAAR